MKNCRVLNFKVWFFGVNNHSNKNKKKHFQSFHFTSAVINLVSIQLHVIFHLVECLQVSWGLFLCHTLYMWVNSTVIIVWRYTGHYFVNTLIYSVLLGFLGMDRFCLGHTGKLCYSYTDMTIIIVQVCYVHVHKGSQYASVNHTVSLESTSCFILSLSS